MTVLQALILGIVQGLTEFLPISSSAHLALAPRLLGFPDPGLAFDVALHVGTLVAVLWYFNQAWIGLARAAGRIAQRRRAEGEEERRVIFLVIATLPGVAAGILLERQAETVFRSPLIMVGTLIVMGVLLWACDRVASQKRTLGEMNWVQALFMGVAQMCAIVPGVSRSGATITAGRAMGFGRESAAVFSFLMSMPITAGAAIMQVPKAVSQFGVSLPMIVGLVASAASGWVAIAVLLKYVSRHGYGVFAGYRIALGLLVLVLILLGRIDA
jgi:undecaprenyl-diphosphatase